MVKNTKHAQTTIPTDNHAHQVLNLESPLKMKSHFITVLAGVARAAVIYQKAPVALYVNPVLDPHMFSPTRCLDYISIIL